AAPNLAHDHMDVGARATQVTKAEDFVALRDFMRERRVWSAQQNSNRATRDKRDREHLYGISRIDYGCLSPDIPRQFLHLSSIHILPG
ncbi:hypothetical protein, partial [Endozoicomonas sp. ONNA2]|uniref:hypothetical protein n=1 Tax=Endozoicomonas sp. ONNA2 TaxID=2828741 RepID=UPI0021493E42